MTTATEICDTLPKAAKTFARIEALDWQEIGQNLDEQGYAALAGVLTPQECKALASLYPNEGVFRSRVVMERHGFGRGEYKYFSYPLPDIIEEMRTELYSRLAPLANKWNESMKIDVRYPAKHAQFIKRWSGTSYALAVAVRGGRLQLSSSGPVWRTCISHSGDIPSLGARQRLYRW